MVGGADDPLETRKLVGKTVGRYRIDAKIGVGGTADVFKAWDPLLKRDVAFKRLTAGTVGDSENRHRILREARVLAALKHPSVTSVYDVLEEHGELFLVEELVSGSPLRNLVQSPLPLEEFYSIAEGCLQALEAASGKGIVHCDLKPGNIVLTRKGVPKILDFGLAQRIPAEDTQDASLSDSTADTPPRGPRIAGTPGYMAPEVIRGKAPDSRSDIFALGVVFYEMLTARHPFRKNTHAETMASVLTDSPPGPSKYNGMLPPGFDELVNGMLQKEPEDRTPTAKKLLADVRRIRAGNGTSRGGVVRKVWRRRAVAVLLLALMILGAREIIERRHSGEFDGYLVVAPFENLSPDPDVDYFATGFTEAVQVRLARVGGLYLVDIDSEIGTRLLLEGGVQRSEDVLRITYRIVDRKRGVNLYADEIQGGIRDLFKLQNLVALGVSRALAAEFPVEALPEKEEPPPTEDVGAYDRYLQARGYLRNFEDPQNVDQAIRRLDRALADDPEFSLAKAALGEAWWKRYEHTKDPADARQAEAICRDAIDAAPDLAEAHVALGTVFLKTGRPEPATEEFRRALAIDPTIDGAILGLADSHAARGQLDEAEATYRRAIEARPDYWHTHNALGKFYYHNGRLPEAIEQFRRVTEITPANARGFSNLGAMYQLSGEIERAEVAYQSSVLIRPSGSALSNLATLLESQGRYEDAAEVYESALEKNSNDYRIWGNLGGVYDLIGGREEDLQNAYRRAIVLGEAQRRVDSNDPHLLSILAQYYARVGRHHEAQEAIDRALEIAPNNVEVLQYVAAPLVDSGDTTRAIEVLRSAFELGLPVEAVLNKPGLANLHEHPEFQQMVREHREPEGE